MQTTVIIVLAVLNVLFGLLMCLFMITTINQHSRRLQQYSEMVNLKNENQFLKDKLEFYERNIVTRRVH